MEVPVIIICTHSSLLPAAPQDLWLNFVLRLLFKVFIYKPTIAKQTAGAQSERSAVHRLFCCLVTKQRVSRKRSCGSCDLPLQSKFRSSTHMRQEGMSTLSSTSPLLPSSMNWRDNYWWESLFSWCRLSKKSRKMGFLGHKLWEKSIQLEQVPHGRCLPPSCGAQATRLLKLWITEHKSKIHTKKLEVPLTMYF